MSDKKLKMIGRGLNTIGTVMPHYAGKLAFDLFCRTDNRAPKSDKEKKLFDSAQGKMREGQLQMLSIPGGQVASYTFAPIGPDGGKKVLIVHGWGSRIDYVQTLVGAARVSGATVVALDLPGHGRSTGRSLSVVKALQAMDAAWQAFGPFYATIGHSFGGYNLVMSAKGVLEGMEARVPEKMVVIASPSRADVMFKFFGRELGLSSTVQAEMLAYVQRISGRPVEYFNAARLLSEVSSQTLILQAEDDKEVNADNARKYAEAGPHVRLEWLNGLGHRRIVNSQKTAEVIQAFLSDSGLPVAVERVGQA